MFFDCSLQLRAANPVPRNNERIFADKIVHSLGLLVELLVQFILTRNRGIQIPRQLFALFGIRLGELFLPFSLRGVAEFFLLVNQVMKVLP